MIASAAAHVPQPANEVLASLYFVVIGYEGNLPLFKADIVPPPENGTGFAVPVDPSGYFVTPAHSVLVDRDMYIMGSFEGKMKAFRAEIVYRGDSSRTESDYAVLKIEASVPRTFVFSSSLPQKGDEVYIVVRLGDQPVLAKGICCASRGDFGVAGAIGLESDIPVIGGDSGGPLLTSDLKLVGISSRGTRIFGFKRTYSCCPSNRIIQKIIDQRKAKQPNQSSTAPRP